MIEKKEPQSENTVETQNKSTPRLLHTPGPWEIQDPLEPSLAIVRAGLEPAEWDFIATIGIGDHGDLPILEATANARLIAAAPELLEACKELREVAAACFRVINIAGPQAIDNLVIAFAATGITEGFGVRAQELIAKAEGASSVPDAAESANASFKQKEA